MVNRGTLARSRAVDNALSDFLSKNQNADFQVLSLGAGSDTRYFRYAVRYTLMQLIHG